MELKDLKNKKILIIGIGKEGIDALKFLRHFFPKQKIGIADQLSLKNISNNIKKILKSDKNLVTFFGKNYLSSIEKYEIIISSPGISLEDIKDLTKDKKVITPTQIFFNLCKGKIIGITATKGKSTTAYLIYALLKDNFPKVHLVGNIGQPALSLLTKKSSLSEDNIFIYELSSHQLHGLKKSPHIAIFLNIIPEHLDWHKTFKNYLRAKQNITRYQKETDYFIYNPKNKEVKNTTKITKAKKIPIKILRDQIFLEAFKESKLAGDFYMLNVGAAIDVGKIFKISDKNIAKAIRNFQPLEHRLELVGTFNKITFYNDSIATNPYPVINALDALKEVNTLILGGYDRGGLNYDNLVKSIIKNNVLNLICFSPTGEKIISTITRIKPKMSFNIFFVDNMKDAVILSYKHTMENKICLLSPGSPSFGIFKNYQERGKLFKKYVKIYGKN